MGKIKWKKSGRNFRVFPVRNGWHRSGKPDTDFAKRFSLPAVVITGVDHREEDEPLKMGNLVLEKEKCSWVFAGKTGGSYSGTGDLFASVLSAGAGEGISYGKLCKHGSGFYLCFYPGRSGRGNRP